MKMCSSGLTPSTQVSSQRDCIEHSVCFEWLVCQHRHKWFGMLGTGGEHVCVSTSVVLQGHLDIHDSWTSLSSNPALFLFPLQGYDESYTDTAYESYDSYYSQPQAWVNQTSLWFSPASHKVHTYCLVASFTREAEILFSHSAQIQCWWCFMFRGLDGGVI